MPNKWHRRDRWHHRYRTRYTDSYQKQGANHILPNLRGIFIKYRTSDVQILKLKWNPFFPEKIKIIVNRLTRVNRFKIAGECIFFLPDGYESAPVFIIRLGKIQAMVVRFISALGPEQRGRGHHFSHR